MAAQPDGFGRRRPAQRGVRLLQVEPDLGAGLSDEHRAALGPRLVVPSVLLDRGPWALPSLAEQAGAEGRVHGVLLLDGFVTLEAELLGRNCTRLILPGDLLLTGGEEEQDALALRWGWSALTETTLAVLDGPTMSAARRWPALLTAILDRAALQLRQAQQQQAISQLPRVEDRLLALLWAVADRCGVVRGEEIWLPLPVTHEVLAHLIGARRPTVSLGLKRLAEAEHVSAQDDGWVLRRDSLQALQQSRPEAERGHD
jgi:CRP/FNR family transcriptional regulator, cyclic AMP receptor protein